MCILSHVEGEIVFTNSSHVAFPNVRGRNVSPECFIVQPNPTHSEP